MNYLYTQHDVGSLKGALAEFTPQMQAAILEVTVEGVSGILEANSPFTAYCRLKDVCCTTL